MRIIGRSGGIEKVEKKQEKRESQARWKARICGEDIEKGWNLVALLSASTGREKRGCFNELASMDDLQGSRVQNRNKMILFLGMYIL